MHIISRRLAIAVGVFCLGSGSGIAFVVQKILQKDRRYQQIVKRFGSQSVTFEKDL